MTHHHPLAQGWQGFMKRWARVLRNRRDVQALSALDDHQLKDIGLTRGDIEAVVAARSHAGPATSRPPHRSRLAPSPETAATRPSRCPS